jgi:hypothetical protein
LAITFEASGSLAPGVVSTGIPNMRTHFMSAAVALLALSASADAANIALKKIAFPNTMTGTTGPSTSPGSAPLSQVVVFEFSGTPQFLNSVGSSIRITVDPSNNKGQPIGLAALGDFEIDGSIVIFRPRLPSGPVPDGFAPGTDIANDLTMPGLLPDTIYRIEVPIGTPNSIVNLTKSKVVLPLTFTTKPAVAGPLLIPSLYSNAPNKAPKVNKDKVKPKPGATGLSPNLFSDPAGLFTSIPKSKKPPFKIAFNAPVDPQSDNVSVEKIRLRVTQDGDGDPLDQVLATEVVLTSNTQSGATISVYPLTILPLGGTIVLEISDLFRALSGTTKNDGSTAEKFQTIAKYRVAVGPGGSAPIDDELIEKFDDVTKQDATIAFTEALQVAGWDSNNSDILRASFGFGGDGGLGRFLPPDDQITIHLDTDFQTFPLFSGATPDAAPGTVVQGGVFNFTDFWLPPNVTLRPRGTNPLVITCTGECLIEGTIDANGDIGTTDVTFDSALASAPGGQGGPGGGKGGDGHPVVLPAGGKLQFMQTPQFGQSGFGPKTKTNPNPTSGGGGGGQSGCTYPWNFGNNQCADYSETGDGSRGSGGGSGGFAPFFPNIGATSMGGIGPEPSNVLISARRGAVGIGNHLPVTFNPALPIPGEPLAYQATAGNPTNAVARVSPNPTFQVAYQQGLIYDNPSPTVMNVNASNWAKTTKVTLFGDPGPMTFTDSDLDNNFIGPGGEISDIRGGQGGGGGGTRTEGLSQICKAVIFTQLQLPFTVNDAKGVGGGGAGGAVMIQALGKIEFRGANAKIHCKGAQGGAAEEIGAGQRGGSGGAGSGGCIILQTATTVVMNDPNLTTLYVLDVSGGPGRDGATLLTGATNGVAGGETRTLQVGDGAPGGPGMVQIHTPDSSSINLLKIGAEVNLSAYNINAGTGANDGTDRVDPLVPMTKTPTPLTSNSVARSTWYDLGLVTSDFRPQIATSAGLLDGPLFGVPGEAPYFEGTDPNTGLVLTDAVGNLTVPFTTDIEVDSPDLFKSDFIPNGPSYFQTVKVEFQGADDDVLNPGLPDIAGATPWTTDARDLNGKRHVRWQVTFNIASNPGVSPVQPSTPRPVVNLLRIPFKY